MAAAFKRFMATLSMEGVPPSLMEDDVNQLDFETLMSELPSSPPEEVPVNQSSISCNDQAGQNLLVNINDSIQQTTRFPPSFPQTMMEGAPPSSVEDDVNFTLNQLELDTLMSELFSFPYYDHGSRSPPEEVPVNQSSILCNDQAGQNMQVDSIQQTTQFPPPFPQTMTAMRGLDGTSSSWINQNGPNWPQTPSSSQQFPCQFNEVPITPYSYDPQSSTMLPESSQTLRHQNSFIHQPQPGHVYMTQNATTSQHGGFNQPTPRIQCIPNQGQVHQASVIPNIDNMQQENLVPRNFGKSTRSQMENLQVHVLQNQIARPNTSNPCPDSSLQSQNRGLNTQQNLIAKHLHLDLSSEDDDLHRAAKLSEELRKKQKWILILDDLWNNFELHEVGIPVPLKGCKLITTTRSKRVCQQISCQRKIEVKPLSEGEAWALFMERLGHEITLSPLVERIAKAVARNVLVCH
uniref:NB-ARC domain-containing protein n=1 Tax=Salix viminalis TaxID=40686 RepID=A0A6N2KW59_SALVM